MRIEFKLTERFIGFAADTIPPGAVGRVITTESLTSHDGAHLTWRLEELHAGIFSSIPGLPEPSQIDNLLVIIFQDLTATAYVNAIQPRALVRVNTPVTAGAPILVRDISDIASLDLGVDIPNDAGFILVRSFGWRKSLFYDVQPLHATAPLRTFDVPSVLARQALVLFQRPFSENDPNVQPPDDASSTPRVRAMGDGLARLTALLGARSEDESQYQELFQAHPWIFAGYYGKLKRHQSFDDENIPDFTAIRHQDGCHDIVELKHPFVSCFRQSGGFSAEFNEAWNQAERYLTFARKNADYLRRQKSLIFENPRCLLIIGYRFNQEQLRAIRDKESLNPAIQVLSYDQLAAMAHAIIDLTSGGPVPHGEATISMYEAILGRDVVVRNLSDWNRRLDPAALLSHPTLDDLLDHKIEPDKDPSASMSINFGGPPYVASQDRIDEMREDYLALREDLLSILKKSGVSVDDYLKGPERRS